MLREGVVDQTIIYVLLGVLALLVAVTVYRGGRTFIRIASASLGGNAARLAAGLAQALAAYGRELARMPIHEARERADPILRGEGLVRVVPATGSAPPSLARFGPSLQECFTRVRRISCLEGRSYADPAELAPCRVAPAYWRLGQVEAHAHLCARPGDERLLVLPDDVADPVAHAEEFPSIYHWLLYQQRAEELLRALAPRAG